MTEFGEFREGEPYHNIEVLAMHPLEGSRRAFDATDGRQVIEGIASVETDWPDGPRLYVFVDRVDPLGSSCAVKHGSLDELRDDETFADIIVRALRHMPLPSDPLRYFSSGGGVTDPQAN